MVRRAWLCFGWVKYIDLVPLATGIYAFCDTYSKRCGGTKSDGGDYDNCVATVVAMAKGASGAKVGNTFAGG